MDSFKEQIQQDIREYQSNFKFVKNIEKDEWAFNYWVLDKLFYEDEELIEEKIIDYNDMAVDAYEIYEDTKDIYIIQNKYYSDDTRISSAYIKNDFLLRPIAALENGTYIRSEELQNAFNKMKDDPDFTVHLQLFVTNNLHDNDADSYIKEFNSKNAKYIASIFYLDDIKNKYYNDVEQIKSNITVKVESINKHTILNINTDDYKLENIFDARYVLTPVVSIYRLYRDSIEKRYPIFDKNIREYLGNKGVNKGIYKTLQDPQDRKNFFYYNNGITIICDSMTPIKVQPSDYNMNAFFNIDNPQIVNGCQTVNSIYEFLQNVPSQDLEKEFKDTFVMLKILVINRNDENEKQLYKDIVKYNNSQNAINEKNFVANTGIFIRLQEEFENKGFLLLIKQSDKNKFSKKYKVLTKLKKANCDRLAKFGLDSTNSISDLHIPLEKLLQVINAFVAGGYVAYVKKNSMLKFDSEAYNNAVSFIKNDSKTIDDLLDLYLLYKKAEKVKKESKDARFPIPYYLIDFFGRYECNGRNCSEIKNNLSDKQKIDSIIDLYRKVSKFYTITYKNKYDIDYNTMIKQNIKYDMVDVTRESFLD